MYNSNISIDDKQSIFFILEYGNLPRSYIKIIVRYIILVETAKNVTSHTEHKQYIFFRRDDDNDCVSQFIKTFIIPGEILKDSK